MKTSFLHPKTGQMAEFDPGGLGLLSAFNASNFEPTGFSGRKGAMKVADYRTTDTLATVETDGYFDGSLVATNMASGDMLLVDASDGYGLYPVTITSNDVALGSNALAFALTVDLPDVHTNGQEYIVVPRNVTLRAAYSAIDGALQTDVTLTFKTPDGTAGTIAIESSGSAAGDVDSQTSFLHAEIDAGETVEIEHAGASSGVVRAQVTLLFAPR